MIRFGNYVLHEDMESLDTESEKTMRYGYIETWKAGRDTIYCIKGNLPAYAEKRLAKEAEKRGYLYWYNNASYFDALNEV